jgi:protein-tyrosine phosphatase
MKRIRVCFVCLGNICRSPTAEAVFRHVVQEAGLAEHFEIDSAGTGAYHVGESPDPRSTAAGKSRGIALTGRARQFKRPDWERFDYVLAMDADNYDELRERVPDRGHLGKLELFRYFDAEAPAGAAVPDPYYGGAHGFDDVIDICERACRGLLAHIRKEHDL